MNRNLTARTSISASEPQQLLEQACAHIQEHGAEYRRDAGRHELGFPFGDATLTERPGGVDVEVAGPTLTAIFDLRGIIASHLCEFAMRDLDIRWTGDGATMKRPPNFRMLKVISVSDLTPRMRRIRFTGDDLANFAGLANIHVRLVFAPEGRDIPRPEIGADGLERWPSGPDQPLFRRYTVRDIDVGAGWLDIDFVLHAEATGPGSRFAQTVRIGDGIGMIGPGGGGLPFDRDWYLIAGDETALPAIARFMEHLPDTARGHVVIEIANDAERQPLTLPVGMSIEWVDRSDGLAEATQRHRPPADSARPFVWIGCEDGAFRKLRAHVRTALNLPKGSHNVVSYWRLGFESS